MDLTVGQQRVLDTAGPLLITGGPGSGKTAISILKAAQLVRGSVDPYQKVLFLSFARATVSRAAEAIRDTVDLNRTDRIGIEVETYHSLFWRLLKTHGYLVGLPRRLDLLTPQGEAVALSVVRNDCGPEKKLTARQFKDREVRLLAERTRLAREEGRVCFDLFAPLVGDLFQGSTKLRDLFATRYPFIILDEFQDTNAEQWRVIKRMGESITPIALADPEQRIFDFIGADPKRLDHFRDAFNPTEIDLKGSNHRSSGTEIVLFGNELLQGQITKSSYKGVSVKTFPANLNQAFAVLVGCVATARTRLLKSGKSDWCLAVLVPTKQMTRQVCDALLNPRGKLPPIEHSAVVDIEGIMLAAELIAFALEPMNDSREATFIELLCRFYRGKGGDHPSRTDINTGDKLETAHKKYVLKRREGKAPAANSIATKALAELAKVDAISRTGNPDEDWKAIRQSLETGACPRLKEVAAEARNLRLLRRGRDLRDALGELWRQAGDYTGALRAVRDAFVREHFASAQRLERGVVVMNMHKAKGKQFDEVIIFEGWPRYVKNDIVGNPDRIVRGNKLTGDDHQARQNLRVSVTRAKTQTTILTPAKDICALFRSGT